MPRLCKDGKQAKKDAEKAGERKAAGKAWYVCEKCGRESHQDDHLCKPMKHKGR